MISRYFLTRVISVLTLLVSAATSQPKPGDTVPGRFIVTYRNGALPAVPQLAGARLIQRHERLGISVIQSSPADAAETRHLLALDPAVEAVIEDRVIKADTLSVRAAPAITAGSDSLYNSPQGWAVRQVGGFGTSSTPGPWSATSGNGVRIAILDSGVDASHPDLAPNLALNLSEVNQSPANGIPSPCDDGSPQDQVGHGTWTASLAAGAFGADTGKVVGVAPQATILNIKVMQRVPAPPSSADPTGCSTGQASGLLSWLFQGIEDAVINRAEIISMSLGALVDISTGDGAGVQATFDHATHAAASAGVLLIAAAGNDGLNLGSAQAQHLVELPAQARDVLAIVAATNPACAENLLAGAGCSPGPVALPYYSNFGTALNALAAPGGSYPPSNDVSSDSGWIWGACSTGLPSTADGAPADAYHSFGCFGLGHTPYVQAMGTSAAAPIAAGAAALILSAHPAWTAAEVITALRQSASTVRTLPVPLINVTALLTPTSAADPGNHHLQAASRR